MKNTSYAFKGLKGGAKYVFKVSVFDGENHVWAKPGKFKTKRAWGVFKLLVLIGALGMFIYGMKIMSEGLQQAAGSRLRSMLGSITSNRIAGVFYWFWYHFYCTIFFCNYSNDG